MDAASAFILIVVIIIGLCAGSYLAALLHRLPRGVSGRRSACPSCGHMLGPRDLVPVLSWLFLRGRCRYCAAPIAARYTLIELGTACVFAAAYIFVF